ncbi:hypothetical protein PUNSTDRAFT_133522 [Punctularia strigosozonata HHB-11173 SS5]|uniref:uncharacterized protein n=1 Tax=Punctularia strigosozonata (strain HHB-11173) TaxID=741275 RepID=UPI0004417792|nr:uncharacterized protein PUNSTDRAFT_133522 [Punctularia strigosozonata HHB-11173 SS5]EIN09754.1 hypothetical protein PUNSTDRAFT_133522 [Punctularia strigosozonata HHB-11173 SS5]
MPIQRQGLILSVNAGSFSLKFLDHLEHGSGIKKGDLQQVYYRGVHGGDCAEPASISETYHHTEKLTDLAPLHNGAALAAIQAYLKSLPNAHSIAYFDTTFHRALPAHVSSHAIDPSVARPLAFDLFMDHILGYVGAYFVALQGNFDALVFAGGIGEKSVELRERVAERVRCLGFWPVDPKKNGGIKIVNNMVQRDTNNDLLNSICFRVVVSSNYREDEHVIMF